MKQNTCTSYSVGESQWSYESTPLYTVKAG